MADKYKAFDERMKKGEDPKNVLDDLGISRYCCRVTFLTSVDMTDEIARFKR